MKKPIQVSDHAVLRYLERAGGFKIEELRAAMAARIRPQIFDHVHTVSIDGHKFVVRESHDAIVVITVLDRGHDSTVFRR